MPNSRTATSGRSLLRRLLLTLFTDLDEYDLPDDTLYQFLCTNPSADSSTSTVKANKLIKLLHPDKNPNPNHLEVLQSAKLISFNTLIKRVLLTPRVKRVNDHCGLHGSGRLSTHRISCPTCTPFDPDGRSRKQGNVEYPRFHLRLSYSSRTSCNQILRGRNQNEEEVVIAARNLTNGVLRGVAQWLEIIHTTQRVTQESITKDLCISSETKNLELIN